MNTNINKQNCEHKRWERTGLWDGINKKDGEPIGGPIIKCVDCGFEREVTYPEWAEIEKEMVEPASVRIVKRSK